MRGTRSVSTTFPATVKFRGETVVKVTVPHGPGVYCARARVKMEILAQVRTKGGRMKKLWRKLFGKSSAGEESVQSPVPSPSVQHDESLDERIDRLWEDARKLGRSDAEQQRAIGIYTELLTLVDEQSTENDMCALLRNRAIAHRSLKNYDAALEDHARELEIAQGRSDHMRVMKCRDLIEKSQELKREVQTKTAGGDKAARLHAMEEQGRRLWHDGPVFETAFGSLFADMENRDPDVRFDASRLLAKNSEALQRLVSIYQECVNSDPWRASLAGRVLGRQFRTDIIMTNAATTQRMYGISASFIHAPCVHCNHRNRGISAPPNGSSECFYAQNDDKGAYAVPVLCDGCGKKFFVVWDSDPR